MEAILAPQFAGDIKTARKRFWDKRFAPMVLYIPILIITMGVHWLFDDPVITLCTGGAVSAIFHIVLAYVEARRCNIWLSPLSFYLFFYSINLGLSAIHTGQRIAAGEAIGFSVVTVYPDNIAAAYIVYLIGSFAMMFGMQALRPLPEHDAWPANSIGDRSAHLTGFFVLWLLGMARRFFGDFFAQLGAIVGMFNWACLAALSAYVLSSESKHRRSTFWLVLGAGTLIELAMNARSGSKAYIMFSFIPILWLFAYERPLRRWLPLLGAGFAILYLGLVQPVVMTARVTEGHADESFDARMTRVYMEGDYKEQADGNTGQRSQFLDRQFDPTPVSFLHREVERSGLRYGETMDYLLYAFIPRIVWPEKPEVTRGAWFTVYLRQARTDRDVTTSTGITAIGELYWNFGLGGVILGMGFLGLFRGYLWTLCGHNAERHPIRFLLYMSLIFGTVDMPEAGTVLVSCVYQLIVFGSIIWLLDYIGRRRAARA